MNTLSNDDCIYTFSSSIPSMYVKILRISNDIIEYKLVNPTTFSRLGSFQWFLGMIAEDEQKERFREKYAEYLI